MPFSIKLMIKMEETPKGKMTAPVSGDVLELDQAVIDSFPIPNTKLLQAISYGSSSLNQTAKIAVQLPTGEEAFYFLKLVSKMGEKGGLMLEGEYESLKAIHSVSPTYAPKPLAFGKYIGVDTGSNLDTYFLLEEFRTIKTQPATPHTLGKLLANLHSRSHSPTGKFGFHIKTHHGRIPQNIDTWTPSWTTLFTNLITPYLDLALTKQIFKPISPTSQSKSTILSNLLLTNVIPRLLLPLQANNRTLKPCLIHGDCWDGNTAEDSSSQPFVFDVCSFYGHNEYDIGNWRAPRHKLSDEAYIREYKKHFPVSEPAEDWDARNRLYSLTFNIGNALYIPGSEQAEVVYNDMEILCQTFFPDELSIAMAELQTAASSAI